LSKRLVVWTLALLAAGGLSATASATIVSTSGQMTLIAAPPSVLIKDLVSNSTMFAFNEQQCVRTAADIPVDITGPGTYDDVSKLTPGVIPAGTLVSSHYVHSDKVGDDPPPIDLEGSITTDADILGIAILKPALDASDVLGAPGTAYPTGRSYRRLQLGQGDFVIQQIDNRTVVVHSHVQLHTDDVRVISRCGERLGAQGCTPGYWKQSQHFDSWAVYTQADLYNTVFGANAFSSTFTLLQALQQGGGGINALGRHSVAALLNAVSPQVAYPITSTQVIALTRAAIISRSATLIEQTKNQLESYNQLGCPVS
jgi:hypothetical protein